MCMRATIRADGAAAARSSQSAKQIGERRGIGLSRLFDMFRHSSELRASMSFLASVRT